MTTSSDFIYLNNVNKVYHTTFNLSRGQKTLFSSSSNTRSEISWPSHRQIGSEQRLTERERWVIIRVVFIRRASHDRHPYPGNGTTRHETGPKRLLTHLSLSVNLC